jgi:hypothetical protein
VAGFQVGKPQGVFRGGGISPRLWCVCRGGGHFSSTCPYSGYRITGTVTCRSGPVAGILQSKPQGVV